ncbi:putative BON1-associated protein 1-like [Sesbania bispinosa]|nr:putative BON1-associated protein 1-like [Sesbania bispinosa]
MAELFLSAEALYLNGKPATKNVFVVVRAKSITNHMTSMTSGGEGFHSWRIGGVRHTREVHHDQGEVQEGSDGERHWCGQNRDMKGENCKEDEGPAGTGP